MKRDRLPKGPRPKSAASRRKAPTPSTAPEGGTKDKPGPSSIQKGNYYRLKTKKWLERRGYFVETVEKRASVHVGAGRIVYVTRDLWGADLLASNLDPEELLVVQVKGNKGDISKGVHELRAGKWPISKVRRIVVWWPHMAREPHVVEVK